MLFGDKTKQEGSTHHKPDRSYKRIQIILIMKGGPQKWRWFLQDEGILLQDHSITVKDDTTMTMEDALKWLDETQNYTLPALLFALHQSKEQLKVADAMVNLRRKKLQQQIPHEVLPSSSRTGNDWIPALVSKHQMLFQHATSYYTSFCRKQQSFSHLMLRILPTLLICSSERDVECDPQLLQLDLIELAAFVKSRKACMNRWSLTFRVCDEDSDLDSWDQQLTEIIKDSFWNNNGGKMHNDDTLQERRAWEAQLLVTKAEETRQEAKDTVTRRQEKLAETRERMVVIKARLEQEIAMVLQMEEEQICIQLMDGF